MRWRPHFAGSEKHQWKAIDATGLKAELGEKNPNFKTAKTAKGPLAGGPLRHF